MNKKLKKMLARIVIAAVWLVVLAFVPTESGSPLFRFVLYLIPYVIIGYDILIKAAKGIKNRQVLDESFLMTIATVGAFALALYEKSGDYTEAVAVMLFYQIGEWFQRYAVGKSRRNISDLMDIRPDYANIEENGKLQKIDPDEVQIGTVIVVQPGEKIPIDGTVIQGSSTLNTSALTGESLPRAANVGDDVISGCINMTGVLKIRTTKEFGESTVAKILDLVENASSRKSKSEDFITKFARVYTPRRLYRGIAVGFCSAVCSFGHGAWRRMGDLDLPRVDFLGNQLSLCACDQHSAQLFCGIGGASKAGILVKGSNYLETLSKTRVVVFDKTGTLTRGVFEVNAIHHSAIANQTLLEYAALAESASSHPISKSIQRAYGKEIDRTRVTDIREISGNGVTATVDGISVAAGNDKLMEQLHISYIPCTKLVPSFIWQLTDNMPAIL